MVNPMTTTREEQRDVVERLRARAVFFARLEGMDGVSECGRQEWSAIVAEVRDAADLIDRLRASQAGGVPAGWMDMADAPRTRPIIVLTAGGRIIKAKWVIIGDDAVGWGTPDEDDPHPNCWHTGFCWASNEDEEPSDPPVGWIEIPSASPPPPATALAAWQDISTAPKDGTWVLCLAKRATVPVIASHQFSTGGIGSWIDKDASDFSGHDDPSEAWIEYWNSNSYTPTHWMPLPPRPDDRTNASEAQSGSLNQALPASSVSATDAVEAERAIRADEREACAALADPRTGPLTGPSHDRWDRSERDIRTKIAATIRARGTDEVGNG